MTESEWLVCEDLGAMLHHVLQVAGMLSERKVRLFACACCRRIGPLLADEGARRTLDVAERYADGLAPEGERVEAMQAGWALVNAYIGGAGRSHRRASLQAAAMKAAGRPRLAERPADAGLLLELGKGGADRAAFAATWTDTSFPSDDSVEQEHRSQCPLFRDIFNPFGAALSPAWQSGDVLRLGQAIYEERAFHRLPVLADALQEAGCTDARLIGHLLGGGPHMLGCWALDLLLDRQ
jgi:hypothetical protein